MRAWQGHWLGALVTPWFINLVLLPGRGGVAQRCRSRFGLARLPERQVRVHRRQRTWPRRLPRLLAVLASTRVCRSRDRARDRARGARVAVRPLAARRKARDQECGRAGHEPPRLPARSRRDTAMNVEGCVRVSARLSGDRISSVTVRSDRPLAADRLLSGRTPDEALAILPNLYAVCGRSQAVVAAAALDVALGQTPGQAIHRRRERELAAETAAEHAFRLLLDWPRLLRQRAGRRAAVAHPLAADQRHGIGVVLGRGARRTDRHDRVAHPGRGTRPVARAVFRLGVAGLGPKRPNRRRAHDGRAVGATRMAGGADADAEPADAQAVRRGHRQTRAGIAGFRGGPGTRRRPGRMRPTCARPSASCHTRPDAPRPDRGPCLRQAG